ncbi:hypothetical protein WALSEDRAFT_61413 [Wallemia mellicola CBS 633.66]|uniref:Uncharacterized protein n=1 Tax=Wallemia mellicola (strain ATCC MYA-4683 / CBS 633.66) TaxID=671144 RepID=I4Y698_WALMC|nr:hypothetical protein WALSEDRAFT_61413 [Wallemia mellicola CBS 633.66]EIM19490.1 hypothetical protein WALSEDRAFT_61413 [Wallemia mellicola CBS 633.66]|eukprot:XP_006960415.1 hypothetical protein WALSEDRAFT_61413 [Wallemia mellicola CBS 633.66]
MRAGFRNIKKTLFLQLIVIMTLTSSVYAEGILATKGRENNILQWIKWVLLDADTSNLRAGIVSLYIGTSFIENECNRNEQGKIINEEGCLINLVVGCIFSVYAIYRLGDGFFNHEVTQLMQFEGSNSSKSAMNSSRLPIKSQYRVREVLRKFTLYLSSTWSMEIYCIIILMTEMTVRLFIWKAKTIPAMLG